MDRTHSVPSFFGRPAVRRAPGDERRCSSRSESRKRLLLRHTVRCCGGVSFSHIPLAPVSCGSSCGALVIPRSSEGKNRPNSESIFRKSNPQEVQKSSCWSCRYRSHQIRAIIDFLFARRFCVLHSRSVSMFTGPPYLGFVLDIFVSFLPSISLVHSLP